MVENFFDQHKRELLYLQDFESLEHYRQKPDYLNYCSNRRIKAKPKGLPPAIRRQQALSVAGMMFLSNIVELFGGILRDDSGRLTVPFAFGVPGIYVLCHLPSISGAVSVKVVYCV